MSKKDVKKPVEGIDRNRVNVGNVNMNDENAGF